ncbi:MAG: O-antigen ligase family protein [Candidatus Eremiobacteraeota bacterium]|nr:O-antigen ligase family protein [Candidatus Eremiobacteraeota bacterium]
MTAQAPPLDLLAAAVYAALGGVVLVATLRRPADAVVALIATAPFSYSHAVGDTTITFAKVALVAAALGIIVRRPSILSLSRGVPLLLGCAILAVVVATAITIAVASDRAAVVRETLKAVQYFFTFAVATVAWSLDPDRERLRIVVTASVAIVAVAALAQEFAGAPSGIWYQGKAYPRIAGPLEGPNQLAGYLGLVLPFLIVFALDNPAIALGGIALCSAALILSLSRAGVFAGLIAAAIVLIARPSLRRTTLVALGSGIVAGLAVVLGWRVAALGERFVSFAEVEQSGGVGTRSILWRAAIALWREHPILGVGAGNYETLLPLVAPKGIRTHANSWYLQSLVEGGLPLLGATLWLVWASILPFRRFLKDDLCLAAFAASIGFALHGIFDLLVFFPKIALTWYALLGVAAAQTRNAERVT